MAPFAVDNDRFRKAREKAERSVASTVVFVGKFTPKKRPQDVLEAARLLPGVDFIMVGEGPLGIELRRAAKDLPNVTFTGFKNQTELPHVIAAADVLLLPSEHEPWGLVVNEAMACGLVPVVSDAVGCAPDLVTGAGETFPTGDIPALCRALEAGLQTAATDDTPARLHDRVERFSLKACAVAYESALISTS